MCNNTVIIKVRLIAVYTFNILLQSIIFIVHKDINVYSFTIINFET